LTECRPVLVVAQVTDTDLKTITRTTKLDVTIRPFMGLSPTSAVRSSFLLLRQASVLRYGWRQITPLSFSTATRRQPGVTFRVFIETNSWR
jgi:hypothetical protein